MLRCPAITVVVALRPLAALAVLAVGLVMMAALPARAQDKVWLQIEAQPTEEKALERAEAELFSVSDQSLKQDLTSLESILTESFDRIEELHSNKGQLRGVRTGYRDPDNMTAGLQRSDLIILAARPAMGAPQCASGSRWPAGSNWNVECSTSK